MLVFKDKKNLEPYLSSLRKGCQIGLVPTMGALHNGHASLIQRAILENDVVVVSIFINPTQFNNPDDLKKYPRTLSKDLALLENIGKNIILFNPTIAEVYGDDVVASTYDFKGLDTVMEGKFRQNHFNGVGTIVEKLFRLLKPHKAYFGEKDYQQFLIIKKMASLRQLKTEVIGCPIVREPNGLAMSSRNERLSATARENASIIYKTLLSAKTKFVTKSAKKVTEWVKAEFKKTPNFRLEYMEIRDEKHLTPCQRKQSDTKYRAFIAVYIEDVRLIDNIAL